MFYRSSIRWHKFIQVNVVAVKCKTKVIVKDRSILASLCIAVCCVHATWFREDVKRVLPAHNFHLPVSQPSTSIIIQTLSGRRSTRSTVAVGDEAVLLRAGFCRCSTQPHVNLRSRDVVKLWPSYAFLSQNPRLMRPQWLTLKSLSFANGWRRCHTRYGRPYFTSSRISAD